MARRITVAHLVGTLAALAAGHAAAGAAVPLASLGGASVQALIDLGGDGVTTGHERYFDFAYAASPASPAAADVRVQSVAAGSADGLRFVADWVADNGAIVSSTVSFDVTPINPAAGAIGRLSLLSNGTAPAPAVGTFVTTTLSAETVTGEPAVPLLSTFDGGRLTPADDVDYATVVAAPPQVWLSLTDTLTAAAGQPGRGGVATASVVQDLFTLGPARSVPEPTGAAVAAVGLAATGLIRSRFRSRSTGSDRAGGFSR